MEKFRTNDKVRLIRNSKQIMTVLYYPKSNTYETIEVICEWLDNDFKVLQKGTFLEEMLELDKNSYI